MITGKEIKNYLIDNYGECRHDEDAMAAAIHDMVIDLEEQRVFKVPTEWELFKLLVENKPINNLMTHSYGFHTATGREIINSIKDKYYGYESVN
tara:strand:+ start:2749 stop:3030 length:282 start_codon:yes stop_codon:yes gene_type:complete